LARFGFESGTVHFVFLLSFFRLENHVCLSHGVQVAGRHGVQRRGLWKE
jgi:hypothetical protein